MKTRISVIIPVYNVEEFLNECVDSVLAQTINNMELTDGYERNLQILLIDDGSTDDSAKIAKKYAEKYDNIEYIYEENQGLGHARNYWPLEPFGALIPKRIGALSFMTLLFQGMKSVHTLLKAHSFSMIQQHGIN